MVSFLTSFLFSFVPKYNYKVFLAFSVFQSLYLLAGVIFFDFNQLEILIVFLLDCVIYFLFGLLKIVKSQGTAHVIGYRMNDDLVHSLPKSKIIKNQLVMDTCFFFFTLITILISTQGEKLNPYILIIPAASLILNHLVNYFSNFIAKQEYLIFSPAQQSLKLTWHIVAVFLTTWFAAVLSFLPFGFFSTVIFIKLAVDIFLYKKEQKKKPIAAHGSTPAVQNLPQQVKSNNINDTND